MDNRWKAFADHWVAAAGGPIPFALRQWESNRPIAEAIRRHSPLGGRLLDVGCGNGAFAALLALHGFTVVGIDNQPAVVEAAHEMAERLQSPVTFEIADAHDLSRYRGRFDLVFSLGVVEHFPRATTIQLIAEQALCAPSVLVAVPTRYTHYAARITDERIYSRQQLNRLVLAAGLRVRSSFVYGQVPTRPGIYAQRLLPKFVYRPLNHILSYGMGSVSIGERP